MRKTFYLTFLVLAVLAILWFFRSVGQLMAESRRTSGIGSANMR